jgi:hypothetical protein
MGARLEMLKLNPLRAGAVIIVFAGLCLYFSGQFPPSANSNEVSRYETVYAFVEKGTFAIDEVTPLLGEHGDKATSGTHFYSNKAPGLALAAIPVYRLMRIVLPRPRRPTDLIFLLLRVLVVSSVCVVALARFQKRLAPSAASPLVAFAVAFGTPFLFYARSFFSHAWTASLLFLSWDLLQRAEEGEHVRRVEALSFAAGLLAMGATISEYPVAPIGLFLAGRAFSGRSWKRLALFAAGAAPPLLLLGVYNAACFGSPLTLSSAREASPLYAGLGQEARFGFGLPSLAIAWHYIADPARGLLLFSPFLLWIVPGFWKWWRTGSDRTNLIFAFASTAVYFLLMTGYANWHGGWALGNRYLLPVLFFAGLALPYALDTPLSRGLFLTAVLYSVAVHFLLTAAWPHFPANFAWPVGNGAAWFLSQGWVAPNLLSRFALASLLPAAAATIFAAFVAVHSLPRPVPQAAVAALSALLLAAGMLAYRPEADYTARLWRAGIFGVYSGLDPSRQELARVALSARTPLERRQAAGAWRIYGTSGLIDSQRR